ncbi:MAG TPA: 4-hydroxy-tetrahydrodipicolinate reductase [Tepidisphaeraceae bacterium]|jgi:4-hydroxy-tetrahydrodipicolinate reductase|nr:4-hydroxy-tetrahydrodipicolinate reductase [Tepidisphaeraceae bacterium]
MNTTVAIAGATGRMGRRLVALSKEHGLTVKGALAGGHSSLLGQDAGTLAGVGAMGVPVTAELGAGVQVVIDFSSPEGMRHWLEVCKTRKIPLVIGTTGLSQSDHGLIDAAAKEIPVLQAPNMSLGVNLLFKIAAQVAKTLGDDYDIEIVEAHHRLKKDAPSGTAMGLADAILKETNKTRDSLAFGRHGDEALRKRGEIGIHSMRIGDEVGKHTAYFSAVGERLELTHAASTRDTFAHGALRGAKWLADKKAGRYTMADVLGLG